jgi:hypothetical protein
VSPSSSTRTALEGTRISGKLIELRLDEGGSGPRGAGASKDRRKPRSKNQP